MIFITVLWWLFPLLTILIKLNSKGPAFFIQPRVGMKNNNFNCYKFRTMTTEASSEKNDATPASKNDSRITSIGSLLRRTNLDEFPQFINVLKGEMSIVGPRPHPLPFDKIYSDMIEDIRLRHRVKPGITGWAQVNGMRGDVEDWEENKKRTRRRIDYDIWYIENWSLLLDIKIIIMTFTQLLSGKNQGI